VRVDFRANIVPIFLGRRQKRRKAGKEKGRKGKREEGKKGGKRRFIF
jgi:hypothetical protein